MTHMEFVTPIQKTRNEDVTHVRGVFAAHQAMPRSITRQHAMTKDISTQHSSIAKGYTTHGYVHQEHSSPFRPEARIARILLQGDERTDTTCIKDKTIRL